ncbi:MAG: lytic transglycosylase domain-containing protein [Magnetococcales bacterium]|nr:lytic transglycosylase domain-containing protein [Magnetococcales bacterium]
MIHQAARETGLDPRLIRAVVAAESDFDPNAVSHAGAVGLMQLMPGTARDMGVSNRFHPQQNLRGGARYLKQMLDQFDSLTLAIAAYNAGPGAVQQYGGIPPYPETKQYVSRVLRFYGRADLLRATPSYAANAAKNGKGLSAVGLAAASAKGTAPKLNAKKAAGTIYHFRLPNGTIVFTDNPAQYMARTGLNGQQKATINVKKFNAQEQRISVGKRTIVATASSMR